MQTALLIFGKYADTLGERMPRFLVHPSCAELGHIPENKGRAVKTLQRCDKLQTLPGFDELDFGNPNNVTLITLP
jgi:hypothetical protein